MIVPPDKTLPDGQGEIRQTISSAWIGICVKSEDYAQGVPGSAQDAPQHLTDAHLPAPAEGSRQQVKTCVQPEKSKPKTRTMLTEAQARDIFRAKEDEELFRTMLTAAQARDIFRAKEFKTPATARLLAEQYDIRPHAVWDIWKSTTWKSHARQWQRDIDERE